MFENLKKRLEAFQRELEQYRKNPNFKCKKKCKTCGYHTPSTKDEDDMSADYFAEVPLPHRCHERNKNFACVGSMETLERLGLWERQ